MASQNALEYQIRVFVDLEGRSVKEYWGRFGGPWRYDGQLERKISHQAFHQAKERRGGAIKATLIVFVDGGAAVHSREVTVR